MAAVSIDDWPPKPDPNSSSSSISVQLGSQPPGYTVDSTQDKYTLVKRYVRLPKDADPNIGLLQYLDDVLKKTRKVLGLRRIDPLPSYANDLEAAMKLQDDSIPIVLLIGGLQPREPLNYSYGKSVLRYHPLRNRYEYVGLLPEPRNHHAAVYYQDSVYVTGGYDPDNRNSGEMVATNTTFCLNIHTHEWSTKQHMISARSQHALVVFKDKLYAIGGRNNHGRLVASTEMYDPDTDQWSLKRPMISSRMGMACCVYDSSIWCIGGVGSNDESENENLPILSSVISYDPVTNLWTNRPPLRCPRAFASSVEINKKLWLCGGCCRHQGQKNMVSMASIDCYDPDETEWYRQTIISTSRHCAAVVSVDCCIYMFGGICSQEWGAVKKNEMIIVLDSSLHTVKELPIPLTGIAAVTIPAAMPSLRNESIAYLLSYQLSDFRAT